MTPRTQTVPLGEPSYCKAVTYKQLAALGHSVGMSTAQRVQWYRIAKEIPLRRRYAGHILSKLKRKAAA